MNKTFRKILQIISYVVTLLLGAGGAGFILFYCPKEKQPEFRERMGQIKELNFKFDHYGSKIIYVGEKVNIWR